MANIFIRELDDSTYYNREITNDNIVFVGLSHVEGAAKEGSFTLNRSLKQFYNNYGTAPVSDLINGTDNVGWEYAANLIRAGFPVLVYSYYKGSTVGSSISKRSFIEIFSDKNLDLLRDRISCRVKFIPTIYNYTSGEISKLVELVDDTNNDGTIESSDGRGDCIIFVDFPEGTAETNITNTRIVSDENGNEYMINSNGQFTIEGTTYNLQGEVVSGTGDAIVIEDDQFTIGDITYTISSKTNTGANYTPNLASSIYNCSYAVVASPSAEFTSPITGKSLTMPPSFWMLKTMAEGVSKGLPIWSVWANYKRASITGVDKFTSNVSMQTMRLWTEKYSIIPLMNIPPYGNVIYGNSTRLNVGSLDGTTNPSKSALDSFNVRLTANEIKRRIFEVCLGLTFDTNDFILWTTFKQNMTSLLDAMKASGALRSYRMVVDNTTVTNQAIEELTVPGIIYIDAGRAAEKFDITFNLTPIGAIFTE